MKVLESGSYPSRRKTSGPLAILSWYTFSQSLDAYGKTIRMSVYTLFSITARDDYGV